MNLRLNDPILLICSGVLLLGLALLVWAFGRLFKGKPAAEADFGGNLGDLTPPEEPAPAEPLEEPVSAPIFRTPPREVAPPVAAAPPVNKEVADRLEAMQLRLAEMQAVLNKQMSQPAVAVGAAPAAGAIGQGFSPETIDKLLKIIGNVIQQVDVLQKNLNVTPASKPGGTSAPGTPLA